MTAQGKGAVRLGIALAVMTILATAAIPSYAQSAPMPPPGPLIEVANPDANAYVRRGKMWIYGNACDPNAGSLQGGPAGTGIKRVAAFFGDRDTLVGIPSWRPGGYLTSASATDVTPQPASELGLPSTSSMCKGMQNAGFGLFTPSLKEGIWDLNVYALSMTGAETHIVIPGIRVDEP
ncbi:MAG: hypothetical protein M3069_14305 [Chloroflexota bacterium]|nr:hypothetical protein [Chloroflexota bacterium]